MSDEILATVRASAARRYLAVAALGLLSAMVLYLAISTSPDWPWRVFLFVLGLAALYATQALWSATALSLELTETELRDSSGVVLAKVEDIAVINRGTFAFKPSNGFMIKTKTKQARAWRPGIWWRLGRGVAVGGVTPGSQTKPMADILSALVAQRDQPEG
jgi:hypothetical protein